MSQPDQSSAGSHLTDRLYKTQLQEFCHRRNWPLPEYATSKEGPSSGPYFKATVLVNGCSFQTTEAHKRVKDAQMEAARIALAYFTAPASAAVRVSAPVTEISIGGSSGGNSGHLSLTHEHLAVSGITVNMNKRPMTGEIWAPTLQEQDRTSASDVSINVNKQPNIEEVRTPTVQDEGLTLATSPNSKRNKQSAELHQYKNLLQSVAQKKGYNLPKYTFECVGPPHAIRFKSRVIVDGQTYESPDFFGTLKESEHAAAKVALSSLAPDQTQEISVDKSIYKNLLQELAQKSGFVLPKYDTDTSGASHMPAFISTVEVGGFTFSGEEAKTKKLAEMNAAKVAYNCLSHGNSVRPIAGCTQKEASGFSVKAMATTDSQQGNKLDSSSKLNLGQGCSGLPKGGAQEAYKQFSPFARTSSSTDCLGNEILDRNTKPKSPTPSPVVKTKSMDYIPQPNIEGHPPPVPSEASHRTVPELFSGPNSALCNIVRVYPRTPNMQFPAGAVVEHSDDRWVSVRFPVNQRGN